jgi:thioredoxin reductase
MPDVAIVGGGPAGLSAAAGLARRGIGVVVIEREHEPGGIPRHADHQGFGLRDLHRSLRGPEYARRLADAAARAGAAISTSTQVTGIDGGVLQLTGTAGRATLAPRATVLATGCRERPRSARLIAGDRPPRGVLTTGTLQQLVHVGGTRFDGARAVVAGAEHVSYSALETLHHAGARATAMTTELAAHQSYAAFALGARLRYRVPLLTETRIAEIHGRERLTALTLGDGRTLEADLLILTADWIPDHELAVLAGARLDPGTRGPAVDARGRTDVPGLFATGNILHGAETADVAAIKGRQITDAVVAHLDGAAWARPRRIVCEAPLQWLVPGPGRALLRAREHLRDVHLELGERHVWLPRVLPGRSVTVALPPGEAPLTVRVRSARRRSSAPRPSAASGG